MWFWPSQRAWDRSHISYKNDNLAHKTYLHLSYIRFYHFQHTCYSLFTPIWYICLIGMGLLWICSVLLQKVSWSCCHLPRLCLDTHWGCWWLPPWLTYTPPTAPTHIYTYTAQYTSTSTQPRNITYQILTRSLIYVMKLYTQSPMCIVI